MPNYDQQELFAYEPHRWYSKLPPQYVWREDIWIRTDDNVEFTPDIRNKVWVKGDEKIPFPKKTKLMN